MRSAITLVLFAILFIGPGCKKNAEPVVTYEVVFKKDGARETLIPTYVTVRPNASMPGKTEFTLAAVSQDFKVHLGITVQVNGTFVKGTYNTTTSNCYIIADYLRNPGQPDERDFSYDDAPGEPPGYFSVTISSLNEKEIKGTFSSNYLYDRTYNEKITITEGYFAAKLR